MVGWFQRWRARLPLGRSLVFKLNSFIVILGFLGIVLLITDLHLSLKTANLREMEERAQVLSTITQRSLIDPLWDFDTDGINDIAEALLQEDSIVLVSVQDISGRIQILKKAANLQGVTVDRFDPEVYFQVGRDIYKGQERIGSLIMIWSKEPTLLRIMATSQRLSVAGFVLIVLVSFSIAFAADHLISRPILKLREETQDVREGNLLAPIDVSRQDELGALARDFAHMRDSVREKQDHLIELNHQLTEQITLVQHAEELARENYEQLRQEVEIRKNLEQSNTQLQNEIARATFQLIQAEKMVLLGSVVADVAHDLANPTQLIFALETQMRGLVSELQKRIEMLLVEAEDEDARLVKTILKNDFQHTLDLLHEVHLGAVVIDGIQSAIRNQSRTDNEWEQFILSALIKECKIILKGKLAPWTIQVICNESIFVYCRRSQLGQVLMNLLSNAVDALDEQGSQRHKLPVHLILRAYTETLASGVEQTILEVEDAGPGIPMDRREKVFEAFFTTKPVGVGTGLGLAICRRIIEQSYGTIRIVEPKELKGACFRIVLPSSPARSLVSKTPRVV